MKLIIEQRLENGIPGGPKHSSLEVNHRGSVYNVTVHQEGKRIITIETTNSTYEDTLSIYYSLQTLLMLFDGRFYPVTKANDGADITGSWLERELACYHSADFMTYHSNKLLDFDSVLCTKRFIKWIKLERQLDIIHKMVLYCLSTVKMPKDMQCAFMIEAYEGFSQLVSGRKNGYKLPEIGNNESKLQTYLIKIIKECDHGIFKQEADRDLNRFTKILVTSRNRIAHIQKKNSGDYLNGKESVIYLLKLSLLYRAVLFDLLGIPYELFDANLKDFVEKIDRCDITQKFLERLGGHKV